MLLSGLAWADSQTGLERQRIAARALAQFEQAARAGDHEAQFHAAQLYLSGEAGEMLLSRAREQFSMAAAGGHAGAAAALRKMLEHDRRADEIADWSQRYTGADLAAPELHCAIRPIPAMSTKNTEIRDVNNAYAAWSDCYGKWLKALQHSLTPEQRVPADLLALMNRADLNGVLARLDLVLFNIASAAADDADTVALHAAFASWDKATRDYVEAQNHALRLTAERNYQRKNALSYDPSKGRQPAPASMFR